MSNTQERNRWEEPVFKALADPSRRKILKLLQHGSRTPGDLAKAFPFTNGSLSHHLNLLKVADLVRSERRGRQLIYSLNTTVIEDAMVMVMGLFQSRKARGGGK